MPEEVVAVTGATGFKGSHLVPRLLKEGYKVRALVRSETKAEPLKELGAEIFFANVTDFDTLEKAFSGADIVIHLVAVRHEKRGASFETINHLGTKNVVVASQNCKVKRFLHISILKADPEAKSTYLVSKWQGEQEVVNSNLNWTVLRPGLIYGPRGEAITTMANLVKRLPFLPVLGDGEYKMQPMYIEDEIEVFLKVLKDEKTIGQVYEIGGPEPLTYNQIMDTLGEVLIGRKRPKIHLPVSINRPFISLGEAILPNPILTISDLELLLLDAICERNAAEEVFEMKLTPFREGLEKTFG